MVRCHRGGRTEVTAEDLEGHQAGPTVSSFQFASQKRTYVGCYRVPLIPIMAYPRQVTLEGGELGVEGISVCLVVKICRLTRYKAVHIPGARKCVIDRRPFLVDDFL